MSKERPTMAEMKYHLGLKFKIFPSDQQKKIIQANIDASRFIYNQCVARNQLVLDIRQIVKSFISPNSFANQKDYRFIKMRRHYTDCDQLGSHYVLKSETPALDGLVKWQMLGGLQNPLNNFDRKSNYQPNYDNYITHYYLDPIKTSRTMKNEFSFLSNKAIIADTLQYAKKNYQTAWDLWRQAHQNGRQTGTPKFHKKQTSGAGSYRVSASYKGTTPLTMFDASSVHVIDNDHVALPKMRRIRVTPKDKQGRIMHKRSPFKRFFDQYDPMTIRIGSTAISKTKTGEYYASFALGSMKPFKQKLAPTGNAIGIDLNVDNFLTTSDGQIIANPKFYRTQEKYLKKSRQTVSRRLRHAKASHRKLSNAKNYQAARLISAKKQERISNQRDSFLHKLSTDLIRNNDLIVLENLKSSNMLKNTALAKSISDVGWRTFIGMLQYKADLYGRQVVLIDPKNTTQTCHHCGYVCGSDNRHQKLNLSDRQWTCPNCGTEHIRDANAAQNILSKGYAKLKIDDPTAEY